MKTRSVALGVLALLPLPAPVGADTFVTSDGAIRVFADDADGGAAPLRSIEGDLTELASPVTLSLDPIHREIFVVDENRVIVHAMDASGNVAPLRVLAGAATGFSDSYGVAVDFVADELHVAIQTPDSILTFARDAQGDVAPQRSLVGPATGLRDPYMVLVDRVHGELYVSNIAFGPDEPSITVYPLGASGDTAPIRVLSGGSTQFVNPRAMIVDLAADELLVTDFNGATFAFARTAQNDTPPLRSMFGAATGLTQPNEAVLTRDGELVVACDGSPESSFVALPPGGSGNEPALRQVAGGSSALIFSTGISSTRARDCNTAHSIDGCLFRDAFEEGDACEWSSALGAPSCP